MSAHPGEHPDHTPPERPQAPSGTAPSQPVGSRTDQGPVHAEHGYVNEVRWTTGQGHQPYANRGQEEAPEPNLGDEFEGGDRGPHSGKTLEQMEQVKKKP